jgi:hypothetical protein
VLVISEMRVPEVAEHLDSGKLVVLQEITADGSPTIDVFRRADAVELTVDEPQG